MLAALTLLPALLLTVGPRLAWPNRRTSNPESRLWSRIGGWVVGHRWIATGLSLLVLLALAFPVLGLRLGSPSNDSLASTGGSAATAITQVERSGLGAGLTQPIEILTTDPTRTAAAARGIHGVAAAIAPPAWTAGGNLDRRRLDRRRRLEHARARAAAKAVRTAAEGAGARVGGIPAQNADFITAVYGNAWWIGLIIIAVTFLLLARALRSIVLPIKALVLNVISVAAAYGVTVLIWQHGFGTKQLFGQTASGSITVWVPIAVFAFLFGLSMDYEVFLLSRIREEHDSGPQHRRGHPLRRRPHRDGWSPRPRSSCSWPSSRCRGCPTPTSRSWPPPSRSASSSTPPSCAASWPPRSSPPSATPTGGCPDDAAAAEWTSQNPRPRTKR